MSSPVPSAPPSGMRDFLPAELARRRHVEAVIRRVYESYGFLPLETPAIENLTTLLGKYGEEGDQLLFRILHRRDRLARALQGSQPGVPPAAKDLAEMGLRYDLTVPLARVMAHAKDLPRFFKRYQIQPVWRADRPGKGRFREFQQCDVDITGTTSLVADAEVCAAVAQVMLDLGLTDFSISLNHRQLLKALIRSSGIAPELEETALVAVDKLDKIGLDGVRDELGKRAIAPGSAAKLLQLLIRPDRLGETGELDRLASLLPAADAEATAALAQLRELLELLRSTPFGKFLRVDASLARGLGYYTGPIFKIRCPGLSGSLGGGGRYDGLIGMFKGSAIPAVGFSIGFERLVLVMEERNLFGSLRSGPDLLLCRFPDVPAAALLDDACQLRAAGLKVEVFPEAPKIGKQIGYAESLGIPVVGILGGNEVAAGQLAVKRLATGDQATLPLADVAPRIRDWLA